MKFKALTACNNGWKLVYRFLALRDSQQSRYELTKGRVGKELERAAARGRAAFSRGKAEATDAQLRRIRAPIDELGYAVACPSPMELMMIAYLEQQVSASRAELSAAEQQLQECESKANAARLDEAAARTRIVSLRDGLPRHLQDPMATFDGPSTPAGAGGGSDGAGSSSGASAADTSAQR